MTVFRRLVFVAVYAGLLSGIFATVAHQIGTVPVILKAEVYEKASKHVTAMAHEHAAWEPENAAERTAYTLLTDSLTAIGFALLLAAGLTLCGIDRTWRRSLLGYPSQQSRPKCCRSLRPATTNQRDAEPET